MSESLVMFSLFDIMISFRPPTTIPPIFEKDEKGRKGGKVSIPVWPEWSDQDIAAEKWVC